MKFLFFIPILFFGAITHAQQPGQAFIDSLVREIPKERDDTLRAKIIYKIVLAYTESNPDSVIAYTKKGWAICRKANWRKGEGSFLLSQGNAYAYKGDYATAFRLLDTALAIHRSIKNYKGIAVALNTIAGICLQQGDHVKATNYFFQSLQLAEQIKDTAAAGDANLNIAAVYSTQNDHSKALAYHLKAVKAYERVQQQSKLEAAFSSVGLDYVNLKEYKNAAFFLEKAMALNKTSGNQRQLAFIYGNFGALCNSQQQYEQALAYYLKANVIWQTVAPGSQHAISITGNIGGAYLDLALHDTASAAAHRFDPALQKSALLANAISWLQKAVLLYNRNGDLTYEAVYGKMLADAYAANGEPQKAFDNYKRYDQRDDSIHSQETKNAIATVEGQREVALRDKEIEINKLALSNQQKTQWALIGGLFLVSIIGVLLFWQSKTRRKANITLLQLNNELDEANKIKARFFAILSHDFRGPVSRLVHFLHLQKKSGIWTPEQAAAQEKRITEAAESLLENMEAMLTWSKGQMENFQPKFSMVKVNDLFDHLQKFFNDTEKVQLVFSDAGNMVVQTDENYLQTIMHNLTSNAIKALQHTSQPHIWWKARQENGKTILSITDNGPGVKEEQVKALYSDKPLTTGGTTGLGLHLVKDLARAIRCTITVQSNPSAGTTFTLSA